MSISVFSRWAAILRPKVAVELGTGDGASAAAVMAVLADDATLTTINWPNPPSGDNPWVYLSGWKFDRRLKVVFGDTRDMSVSEQVPDGITMLHIDSTHTNECASAEWRIYEPKLADAAVVIVDDLDHGDMYKFWNCLKGIKMTEHGDRVGILRYRRKWAKGI